MLSDDEDRAIFKVTRFAIHIMITPFVLLGVYCLIMVGITAFSPETPGLERFFSGLVLMFFSGLVLFLGSWRYRVFRCKEERRKYDIEQSIRFR